MDCMKFYVLFLITAYLQCLDTVCGSLDHYLEHYETIHINQLKHKRTRRQTNEENIKQIEVRTLGRDFHLYLKKNEEVLSSDFKLFTADKANNKHMKDWQGIEMYKGYVIGEEASSDVQAVWEDDSDDLLATIITKDEVYSFEPSWRHLPKSENYSMIAYRHSDMKNLRDFGRPSCGYAADYNGLKGGHSIKGNIANRTSINEFPPWRGRRDVIHEGDGDEGTAPGQTLPLQAPWRNTCPVLLVADFKFFNNMGMGSVSKTSSYLIAMLDRVNTIFRGTIFSGTDGGFTNMGFEVKEILIHEQPTSGTDHYNSDRIQWDKDMLLEVFSKPDYSRFCLAHLFTYQAFAHGVIGLAGIGGICSAGRNTGWSSSLNQYHSRLLTTQADLVTAHEFGHNWGSNHDPDSDECSPTEHKGGKYIMYTYSVTGYETNNMRFSPCSKRLIKTVLADKITSSSCFKEKQKSYCGNNRVERPDEQCDVGPRGKKGDDPCCTVDCQLRATAQCSDSNDDCCSNCTFAPRTQECYKGRDLMNCEDLTYCTGKSASCPEPNKRPDDAPCGVKGKCRDGTCINFCETEGQIACICDAVEDACKWCCKKRKNSTCKPYIPREGSNETMDMPDGMPCVQGICDHGQCKKLVEDLTSRIGKIIENVTPDQVVDFMKTNIVGTVIILSLIFWIPASCIISWQDRKKLKEEEGYNADAQSVMLLDYPSIRRSQKTLQRRYIPNPNTPNATLRLHINKPFK